MKVKFISKTKENHDFFFDADMKKFMELPVFLESVIDKDKFGINLLFQILKNNVRNFKKDECEIIHYEIDNVLQCKIMNKNFTYFGINVYKDSVFINIYPEDITRDFICDIESILIDNRITFSDVVIERYKVGFKNMHFIDEEEGICEENTKEVAYDDDLELSLVPPQVIIDMAEVIGFENRKYGNINNQKTVDIKRHNDAAYRHLLAYIEDPSSLDEESGIEHYKHMACDLAFICHIIGKKERL